MQGKNSQITWAMCSHAKINACTFFVIQMYVWRTATSEQQTPVALLYTKYKLFVHPQQTQTSSMHIYVYNTYTDTYTRQQIRQPHREDSKTWSYICKKVED